MYWGKEVREKLYKYYKQCTILLFTNKESNVKTKRNKEGHLKSTVEHNKRKRLY